MANVKNKTPDRRRTRRSRYAAAITPIREKFGCTAMQAAGHVQSLFSQSAKLAAENAQLKDDLRSAKEVIELAGAALEEERQKNEKLSRTLLSQKK